MTRRELLLLPGAAPLLGHAPSSGEPQNLTFPLDTVEGTVIPPELFFVRDHFREPEISLSTWRLRIEGRVTRPLDLSLADIIESPAKQLEAVLECAGNPAGGTAAGDAMWEGVPLGHLLELAGAAQDAAGVLLEGSDAGRLLKNSPPLPYCRLVPAAKCLLPESLLAFKLNGRFLPHRNGFPARALFPGWYGMDSVKWLRRMVVLGPSEPAPVLESSGMNKLYNRMIKGPGGELTPTRLTEVLVKSMMEAGGQYQAAGGPAPGSRVCLDRQWFGSQRQSQRRWRTHMGAGSTGIGTPALQLGSVEVFVERSAGRPRAHEPGPRRRGPRAATQTRWLPQRRLRAEFLRAGAVLCAMKRMGQWAQVLCQTAKWGRPQPKMAAPHI